MKILYLVLENYNSIYTAFGKEKIEIDLSKANNRVILLRGPNGSGKTSILSSLHPFSNNGNLDPRNNLPLIRLGEKGYKEIHISNDEDIYIIKHYYTPNKDTHSVKSYIEKNGSEININGNVSSFKEILKEELNISQDYLKLSRLGSNVTNFIDLKDTERKEFMGKLLSDVEIYLRMYKNATAELRAAKTVISHTVDKLDKLNITDITESKAELKNLKKRAEKGDEAITEIKNELSVLEYKKSQLGSYDDLSTKRDSLHTIYTKIENLKKDMSREDLEESLKKNKSSIEETKLKIVAMETELKLLIENLDNKHREYSNLKEKCLKIESSDKVKELKKAAKELTSAIEERSKAFKLASYETKVNSNEVNSLIVDIDRCIDIGTTTYEFGLKVVEKALSYIINKYNMKEYIDNHRKMVRSTKLHKAAETLYNELDKVPYIDCKKKADCLVYKFYNRVEELALEVEDETIEDTDFVNDVSMAYQNINTILKIIDSHSDTIKNLPKAIQETLSPKAIFTNIGKLNPVCDKTEIYGELSLIKEKELLEEDIKRLNDIHTRIKTFKESDTSREYIKEQILTIERDIKELSENEESLTSDIRESKNLLEKNEGLSLSIEKYIDYFIQFDEISKELSEIEENLKEYDKINSRYNTLVHELNTFTLKLENIKTIISDLAHDIDEYTRLTAELEELRKEFDDIKLIQSALSTREGIPLLYMKVHLGNIENITNKLLFIAYDDLNIEPFVITEDSFRIPYYVKGERVSDVNYASQGEKSFITLALSFALIYESISSYNIMLLDEIDSTLDERNRGKFLEILEAQMDMIDSEQIFLITHNNMFNAYPVSIIDTKNENNSDNRYAEYIPII